MSNKQAYIDFILEELNKGNILYKDVYLAFLSKFKLSEPTFVTYWKKANETYKDILNKRQKELADISTEAEKERLKMAILTKHERMKIASDIGKGKAWKVGDEILIPTSGDRLRALDYLSKVEGDYAAIKTETEITVADKPKMKLPDGTEIEI